MDREMLNMAGAIMRDYERARDLDNETRQTWLNEAYTYAVLAQTEAMRRNNELLAERNELLRQSISMQKLGGDKIDAVAKKIADIFAESGEQGK